VIKRNNNLCTYNEYVERRQTKEGRKEGREKERNKHTNKQTSGNRRIVAVF
jgi:hypothetical protein